MDRVDRRLAMAAACLVRAAALATLGLLAAAGRAGLPLLYVVFLLVGGAGVVYENAATAVLPDLVGRAGLTRANGRLQAATSLSRSLLAQPLGGWLFTVAPWVPFLIDTAGLLLVTFLTTALPRSARGPQPPGDVPPRRASPGPAGPGLARSTWRASIGEGLAWLAGHRPLRALALAAALSNLGLGALFSSAGAALRQSLAPPGMLGRVQGAYRAVSNCGMLAGAALGGLLTTVAGLTAPLWLGLAASTAVIALSWRAFATLR